MQMHKFTIKKESVSAAFRAHSWNYFATFKKNIKKWLALSPTNAF